MPTTGTCPLPAGAYRLGQPLSIDHFLPRVRHCAATAQDITLCYQTFGEAFVNGSRGDQDDPQRRLLRRPVVILLPGLGSSCYTWRDAFCEALAAPSASTPRNGVSDLSTSCRQPCQDGCFVIRLDNRDSGLSTHLETAPTLGSDTAKLAVTLLPRWWWRQVVPIITALLSCLTLTSLSGARCSRAEPNPSSVSLGLWGILRSPKPPYTISDMAADVKALLLALQLQDGQTPVHLVGQSMGGRIAQELVMDLVQNQQMTISGGRGGGDDMKDKDGPRFHLASVTLIATHTGKPVSGYVDGHLPLEKQRREGGAQWASQQNGWLPRMCPRWFLRFVLWLSAFLLPWLRAACAPCRRFLTASGWSWEVIAAMLRSSSSSKGAEGNANSAAPINASASTQEDASKPNAAEEATKQRAAYASHFYGLYPPPDPAAYRAVKKIDLTRAPVDAAATMRQMWAVQMSEAADERLYQLFHGPPTRHYTGSKPRSPLPRATCGQENQGTCTAALRVLVIHGLADNTIHFANAIRLASLFDNTSEDRESAAGQPLPAVPRCKSKAVLYPRMGHTIPEQLYDEIVTEIKSFCL